MEVVVPFFMGAFFALLVLTLYRHKSRMNKAHSFLDSIKDLVRK